MVDLGDLMKQAQKFQEQMQKAQEESDRVEVTGESGGGLVKVVMTGRHDVRQVTIDPAAMDEDRSFLEDLVAAAFNDAVRKVESSNRERLSKMTSGLGIPPDFKMPF